MSYYQSLCAKCQCDGRPIPILAQLFVRWAPDGRSTPSVYFISPWWTVNSTSCSIHSCGPGHCDGRSTGAVIYLFHQDGWFLSCQGCSCWTMNSPYGRSNPFASFLWTIKPLRKSLLLYSNSPSCQVVQPPLLRLGKIRLFEFLSFFVLPFPSCLTASLFTPPANHAPW